MIRILRSFIPIMVVAYLFTGAPAFAEPAAQCEECGMTVKLESKFCAKILLEGKTLQFCDIGDLLTYLNKKKISPSLAQVKDQRTGEWISADKAYYVHSEKTFKTPMGWDIAAFKTKEDAAAFGTPLDIKGILGALK